MFQVRFHGRGGQGVVTAAKPLAAAFLPCSGMNAGRAHTREPVTEPDALIIQDPTLLHQADLFAGLGLGGYMLVNSARGFGELGMDEFVRGFRRDRLLFVPASSLAMTHPGRPLPGAALLGGFAALTWAVSLDSVLAAISERFAGTVAEGNAAAARAAFDFVRDQREALTES